MPRWVDRGLSLGCLRTAGFLSITDVLIEAPSCCPYPDL